MKKIVLSITLLLSLKANKLYSSECNESKGPDKPSSSQNEQTSNYKEHDLERDQQALNHLVTMFPEFDTSLSFAKYDELKDNSALIHLFETFPEFRPDSNKSSQESPNLEIILEVEEENDDCDN
jgi:hypothetical protein